MNPRDTESAQRIVADYAALLERDSVSGKYPSAARDLPYAKPTIKEAIRTCAVALAASRQLTGELRDFLEISFVSLADYLEDDLVRLLSEFNRAGQAFATDGRQVREKLDTSSWSVLTEQSRLAGEIAANVARETEALRDEFRTFCA